MTFDVSSACNSKVIISRASLIICEYSNRSSVSVGDAARRSVSTLKIKGRLNQQRLCSEPSHVQPTRLESDNQQSERSCGDKNQITRAEGRMYANQGPKLLILCIAIELRQDLVKQSWSGWSLTTSPKKSSNRHNVQCRHDGVHQDPYMTRTTEKGQTARR